MRRPETAKKTKRRCKKCNSPIYRYPSGETRCTACRAKRARERRKTDPEYRERKDAVTAKWREDNPDRNAAYCKTVREEWKLTVLRHYSGGVPQCACCEEPHVEFLTIDHIGNDGAAHRKVLRKSGVNGSTFYWWLIKNNFPDGFQVLCMNCNFAKGAFGECPHETERRKRKAS